MKKAQQKKAARHIYSSGLAGCGGKSEPTNAKNAGQALPCPFCDRTFKQDGRLKEHIKSKHADGHVDGAGGGSVLAATSEGASGVAAGGAAAGSGSGGGTYFVKTPKIQLNEWCQKNKRPAAKYKNVQVEGGAFHCRVILPDPKDANADVILWHRGMGSDTADLAQQRAATVALHHVMGDRRLDRVLPGEYRQQWLELDQEAEHRRAVQAQRSAGHDRQRAARERQEERSKERVQVYLSQDRRQLVEGLLSAAAAGGGSTSGVGEGESSGPNGSAVWESSTLEGCSMAISNGDAASCDDNGPVHGLSQEAQQQLVQRLQGLGFATSWAVKAAAARPGDYMAARDWLVLNVPEAELPRKFAPQSSAAALTVLQTARSQSEQDAWGVGAAGQAGEEVSDGERIEEDCVWLCECGFEVGAVREGLADAGGDETRALALLLAKQGQKGEGDEAHAQGSVESQAANEAVREAREEEGMVLEAIYGSEIVKSENEAHQGVTTRWCVKLGASEGDAGNAGDWEDEEEGARRQEVEVSQHLWLSVIIPPSSSYPFSAPLIALHSPLSLPRPAVSSTALPPPKHRPCLPPPRRFRGCGSGWAAGTRRGHGA